MISGQSISRVAKGWETSILMDAKEIREVRLLNLAILVQECGTQAALARKADTNPAYLSQLMMRKRHRRMGDDLARKLEAATGKTRGWMDTQHPELWGGTDMAKAAGRPLVQTSHKAAQLTWLEAQQSQLSENSLGTIMQLVERLRELEKLQNGADSQPTPPAPPA